MTICQNCKGTGKVKSEANIASIRPNEKGYFLAPGGGYPIPCPVCRGKKYVNTEPIGSIK